MWVLSSDHMGTHDSVHIVDGLHGQDEAMCRVRKENKPIKSRVGAGGGGDIRVFCTLNEIVNVVNQESARYWHPNKV